MADLETLVIYAEVNRTQLERWWSLLSLTGIGAKLPYKIWKKTDGQLLPEMGEYNGRARDKIQALESIDHVTLFSNLLDQLTPDIDIVVLGSEKYPRSLLELESPPLFLFVKGNVGLLHTFGSAVVGTRHPDREALRLTDMVVQRKVVRGHTIISGGAIGIDTAAHRSALEKKGKTIVVAPSGIRALTPTSNRNLFDEIIASGGCIISEYPPFSKPRKYHFHRRNGVLAALSNEVIVVRAAKSSGTLITAKAAIKLGKEVFSIPGSPLDPIAEGSNLLLENGDANFFDFCKKPKAIVSEDPPILTESELQVYALLSSPKTIDEIYDAIKIMRPNEILSQLTMMEISGHIEKDPRIGGYRRA